MRLKVLYVSPLLVLFIITLIELCTVFSLLIFGGCGGEESVVQYTLKINTEGSGTTSGGGIYNEGTAVYISCHPDAGWEFIEWSGDIDTIGDHRSSRTMILMNKDYVITAEFNRLPVVKPYTVSNVVFDPQWPVALNYGEWVNIKFEYEAAISFLDNEDIYKSVVLSDVYVLIRPFSEGVISPGCLVREYNFLQPWDKEGKSEFTINPQVGQVVVDQIRFQITNADKTIILQEYFFQADYTFR